MLKNLFYLSLFTLVLGQFTSLSKIGSSNLYLFDLIVIVFTGFGFLYFLLVKNFFVFPKSHWMFVIFVMWALVTIVVRIGDLGSVDWVLSAFYLFRFIVYLGAGLVVFNMFKLGMITYPEVVSAFLISGVFLSLVGFLQILVLPDFEKLDSSLGWDPHKNRLASTFFDPNFVGCYLVMCLVLGLERLWGKFRFLESVLYLLIPAVALFLTFSRSAWLMGAVVILVYGVLKSRWLLIGAFIIVFLAYFAVPRIQTRISGITDPADSAHFRLISWGNALNIAKDNLVLGVGFNSYRYAQKEFGYFEVGSVGGNSGAGADSSILLVLATTGVLGLIIFTIAFVSLLGNRSISVLSIVLGLIIQSQFINSLFYPQIMFFWMVVIPVLGSKAEIKSLFVRT